MTTAFVNSSTLNFPATTIIKSTTVAKATATATKDTLVSTIPVFDGGVENKTILPTTGNTIYSGSSTPTSAVVGSAPIPEAVQNGIAPKEEVARVVAQQTDIETPVQDVVVEKKTKQNSKRYIVIVAIVAVVIYLLYKSKK